MIYRALEDMAVFANEDPGDFRTIGHLVKDDLVMKISDINSNWSCVLTKFGIGCVVLEDFNSIFLF